MAIDINQEVQVWGGFSPQEFWIGAAVLVLLAVFSVALGVRVAPFLGALCFFTTGGGFVGFMVYRQGLPKGLLLRRFRQEGRFLFFRVPGLRGVDLYQAAGRFRERRFVEIFRESDEGH